MKPTVYMEEMDAFTYREKLKRDAVVFVPVGALEQQPELYGGVAHDAGAGRLAPAVGRGKGGADVFFHVRAGVVHPQRQTEGLRRGPGRGLLAGAGLEIEAEHLVSCLR